MPQDRKWEKESTHIVTGNDGRQYTVVTMREYIRQQFEDGTWSEGAKGERRFYLNRERLRPIQGDLLEIPSTGVTLPMPQRNP